MMQVSIEDFAEADRRITILMGDKVEPRREYISEYADFNQEDHFRARNRTGEVDMAKKKRR